MQATTIGSISRSTGLRRPVVSSLKNTSERGYAARPMASWAGHMANVG
jgi:hypothetical protein